MQTVDSMLQLQPFFPLMFLGVILGVPFLLALVERARLGRVIPNDTTTFRAREAR